MQAATEIVMMDLSARSHDVHWPAQFRPEAAALFSHNELLIAAPCERVWKHIVDSHVHEYTLNSRLGWYGYAPGTAPAFYHTWLLQPRASGCLVITEEAGLGKDAAQLRKADEGLLHRGHDLWLATLKWVSEAT
jgi:hypothetical protein